MRDHRNWTNRLEMRIARPSASAPRMASEEEALSEVRRHYAVAEKIGEGSYGTVYGASCLTTGRRVAIKRSPCNTEEGVPTTALREMSLLRSLRHPHVIKLYDVIAGDSCIFLIFDRFDLDLRRYLRRHGAFHGDRLRQCSRQLFSGLAHCHQRLVLHRDLKPQNILLKFDANCAVHLVLADLGLARMLYMGQAPSTHQVCTLWYRSIELLLGQVHYGPAMDVWSLGCILSEMATTRVLFPGDCEIDTIFRIFKLLGTPSEITWPGVSKLEHFSEDFPIWSPPDRLQDVGVLGEDGLDLLEQCLNYKAAWRMTAPQALRHPFCRIEMRSDETRFWM